MAAVDVKHFDTFYENIVQLCSISTFSKDGLLFFKKKSHHVNSNKTILFYFKVICLYLLDL